MELRKVLVAVFLLFSIGVWAASGIDKMFVHRSAGDESLYFIFSRKMPADKETKSMVKSMDFDYTYLQKTDSVSMLVSFSLPKTVKVKVAEINIDDNSYSGIPELIYADPKGKKINYRYRIVIPFDLFENMYVSQLPFSISFCYLYRDDEENITFKYDGKTWQSYREKMISIIDLIKLNTGKQ